jgi:uncharacterized protein YodC (DUF2158 family)
MARAAIGLPHPDRREARHRIYEDDGSVLCARNDGAAVREEELEKASSEIQRRSGEPRMVGEEYEGLSRLSRSCGEIYGV